MRENSYISRLITGSQNYLVQRLEVYCLLFHSPPFKHHLETEAVTSSLCQYTLSSTTSSVSSISLPLLKETRSPQKMVVYEHVTTDSALRIIIVITTTTTFLNHSCFTKMGCFMTKFSPLASVYTLPISKFPVSLFATLK
jgi:hypothetical protein